MVEGNIIGKSSNLGCSDVKPKQKLGSAAINTLEREFSPSKINATRSTKHPKDKTIDDEVIKYFKRIVKN